MPLVAEPSIDWSRYYGAEAGTRRFVPEEDPAEAERCAFAERLLPAGPLGRVLELGAGDGHLAGRLARRPRTDVVCLDLVPLRAARARLRAGGAAVAGAAPRLPFRRGSFDVVTLVEVLEHLPDPGRALGEIARVAAGGMLVLSVPFEQCIPRVLCPHCLDEFPVDGHLHSFSEGSLSALLTGCGLPPARIALHRPEPPRLWEARAPFRWLGARGRAGLKRTLRRAGVLDLPPARYLGAVVPLGRA